MTTTAISCFSSLGSWLGPSPSRIDANAHRTIRAQGAMRGSSRRQPDLDLLDKVRSSPRMDGLACSVVTVRGAIPLE
jgi:hypothetical protein